jgi:hypothetical protein
MTDPTHSHTNNATPSRERRLRGDRFAASCPVPSEVRAILVVLSVAACACAPLATATVDVVPDNAGTIISVTARSQSGPDGDHGLSIFFSSFTGPGTKTFFGQRRSGDPPIETPGPACSRNFFENSVACPFLATTNLSLGDGADDVTAGLSVAFQCVPEESGVPRVSVQGTLGAGADRFTLRESSRFISDSDCTAGARPDLVLFDSLTIDGAEGSDRFEGARDRPPRIVTWTGGTGADTFIDGVGIETFVGGPNRDTVSYLRHTRGMFLSPGLTELGDGPDGDDIRGDVEVVIGGRGNDQFIGNASGNEFLGGPGADIYQGAGGGDLIIDVDGTPDRVDCGTGTDEARLDLTDVVTTTVVTLGRVPVRVPTCETISRTPADDGPPAVIITRPLRLASPTVGLTCLRTARIRCRGLLSLRDPTRPGRILATTSYSVPLHATRSLPIALGEAALRTLRARGSTIVTTVERGVSRKGPRSARRLLRVVG